jgi:hypothetical protein
LLKYKTKNEVAIKKLNLAFASLALATNYTHIDFLYQFISTFSSLLQNLVFKLVNVTSDFIVGIVQRLWWAVFSSLFCVVVVIARYRVLCRVCVG